MSTTPRIFVGWALSPAIGAWIDCTQGLEEAQAAVEAIRSNPNKPADAVELCIPESQGFHGLVRSLGVHRLAFICELAEALDSNAINGEVLAAFCEAQGHHSTIASGAVSDLWDLDKMLNEAYVGTWESGADFAEERWKELNPELAAQIPDEILESVDWSKVWAGWETSGYTSADVSDGVAIFNAR